jgi:hypothetical protein
MWEKMVRKCKLPKSIPLHTQGLNFKTCVCESKDHVGEKGLNLNWSIKLGLAKKNPLTSFLSHLLKNT